MPASPECRVPSRGAVQLVSRLTSAQRVLHGLRGGLHEKQETRSLPVQVHEREHSNGAPGGDSYPLPGPRLPTKEACGSAGLSGQCGAGPSISFLLLAFACYGRLPFWKSRETTAFRG